MKLHKMINTYHMGQAAVVHAKKGHFNQKVAGVNNNLLLQKVI